MEYITTKEASAKWGISAIRITVLANEGRIPGAHRLGRSWLIPANAIKPPELKANHSGSVRKETKETDNFSFPLYHFRPDWSYIEEEQLSEQQRKLFMAETAVLECRFADAYPLLESILRTPDDTVTEVGSLWNAGICCIALNKPSDFSRIFLRLQFLLSEDFPHRDDLIVILNILKTYVETISYTAKSDDCNTDIHDQSLPSMCIQTGYSVLSKEAMNPGTADTNLLELNLRFLKNTSAVIIVEMMHIYLLGIYSLRQDMESAKKHAKAAVQIAFENQIYYPVVTYYRYFTPILSSAFEQYPKEFQDHCQKMSMLFEENYTAFLSSLSEYSVLSKLTDVDYPYAFAVLMDLTNADIADKMGVSQQTVKRRLERLCEKLGVNNKKELKNYLHNYM